MAILFDRTEGWLPIRSEMYVPSAKATHVCEYAYQQFGDRSVMKSFRSERRLDSGTVFQAADLEYQYESYTPVKSDFSLEQFGLPDLPEYQKPKPQQRYGVWILGGGVVLIVLALTFRSLRSRLKKRLAQNGEPQK